MANKYTAPPRVLDPEQLSGDDLTAIVEGTDQPEEYVPFKHVDQRKQYGNAITITSTNATTLTGAPVFPLITTPLLGDGTKEVDCTVILSTGTAFPQNSGYIVFVITYGVGATMLTKVITTQTTVPKYVFLTCRNVQISVQFVSASGGITTTVQAVIVPGTIKERDAFGWSAQSQILVVSNTNGSLLYPSWGGNASGILGALHVILYQVSTPGTPMWLMLFDSITAPSPGTDAIPLGISDTLSEVGDTDSYAGVFLPEGITFSKGLWAALSTTVTSYTQPASNNKALVQAVIGT